MRKYLCTIFWSFAFGISKLRSICCKIARYLQHFSASTCTFMVWCNISSLHGALPSGNILQQCKANIGKLHNTCKIWSHIWKLRGDVHSAAKQKTAQRLETKNYHVHSMCSILGQILVHCIVFAVFATIIGKPHGTRSVWKLTSVNWMLFLRLSEAQTYKWLGFAKYWNYHLQIAHSGMVFAACCG